MWSSGWLFGVHGAKGPDVPLLLLLFIAIPFGLLVFWIWMYREMLNNDRLSPAEKNFWTIAFIFFNVLTAAYYYSTEYRNRRW